MEKTNLIILFAIVLAIADIIIYGRVNKYLFIAAGVTQEDAQKYRMAHQSTNKKSLYVWMRNHTKHAKEFHNMMLLSRMFFFLFACTIFMIFLAFQQNNLLILYAYFAVSLLFTVAGSIAVFSYGKHVERECSGDFSSSEYATYVPYDEDEPEYIENTEEPYDESNGKAKHHNSLLRLRNDVIPILILLITFGVMKALDTDYIKILSAPKNHAVTDVADPDIAIDESLGNDAIHLYSIYNQLLEEGFACYDSVESISGSYPQYQFDACIQANADGISISCYALNDGWNANDFCNEMVSELIETGGHMDTFGDEAGDCFFTTYYRERYDGFVALVYSDKYIITANCNEMKTEWLKDFLYDNGFLETV